MFQKVTLGISGGVDSAVAALLLKSKGFKVRAVFMKNWDVVNEFGECQAEKDFEYARWVCDKLKIPLIDANFVKEYWNDVFSNLIYKYENGGTPNPDILCNKKIKFNKFFEFALNHTDADAIATGHYARNSFGPYLENYMSDKNAALLKAKDEFKDQTFFLSQIPQSALRKTMFPLGNYLKKDVKKIASEANLNLVVNKKESMGMCFIGKRNFKKFIVKYIEDKPGNFIDIVTGRIVGKHNGIHQWTLGQRCKIAGMLNRYFVYQKDVNNNNIYVVPESNHKLLFSEFLVTKNLHWINKEPDQLSTSKFVFDCYFRFQHTYELTPCTVYKTLGEKLAIRLYEKQRCLTPGQFAVLYYGDECLGSSEIISSGPSCYFLNEEVGDELTEEVSKLLTVSSGTSN